jgi:hypothetical protein
MSAKIRPLTKDDLPQARRIFSAAVNLPASHTRGDFERVMPMAEDPP